MVAGMPSETHRRQRRIEIAEATWRVIERAGPTGASMREIAREAGYTTGVLSHHFRDKHELVTFAFELAIERSTARAIAASQDAGLVDGLAALLPLDQERRRLATLWMVTLAASRGETAQAAQMQRHYRQAQQALLAVLHQAVGAGSEQESAELVEELLVVVDGITVNALTDPDSYPPDRQVALLQRAARRRGLEPDQGTDRTPLRPGTSRSR